MPARDWFDWVLGVSQIIGAFATAAAGFFAALAFRANRDDRIEREKPFLAAKTGEFVEASIPEGIKHPSFNTLTNNPANQIDPILVNVGNGPLIDLSMQLGFRLKNDEGKVLAHTSPGGFMGEGVIAVGNHLPTEEIISQINFFLYALDSTSFQTETPIQALGLEVTLVTSYRDRGLVYYTQTFFLFTRLELYELIETLSQTFASDAISTLNSGELEVVSRTQRTRSVSFYHVRQDEQIAISRLPLGDWRRFSIEHRDAPPEKLEAAKKGSKGGAGFSDDRLAINPCTPRRPTTSRTS